MTVLRIITSVRWRHFHPLRSLTLPLSIPSLLIFSCLSLPSSPPPTPLYLARRANAHHPLPVRVLQDGRNSDRGRSARSSCRSIPSLRRRPRRRTRSFAPSDSEVVHTHSVKGGKGWGRE
ncbi:hypothetical protein K523DRAFT_63525 [Schizophyllum commune Tattone D]|nr:hypothetical protein K523DRAFT_63525 [Schizophyllum commune Tattone D]